MVKSLVSKLSSASNLSLASTLSSVGVGSGAQETNYAKHRNDPGRFFGDGVQFKAKLIGILEVGEARGDRMCQEALQDLKMAIRAAGEHKQRITIHVTIDGLRLRDEKTGDSLYHHPVHKISFIAQDMTDSRAFGYIFGSPDSGHRFFGIKTDKAASQVVLAMRDLFQVVFELKKKEIELARQQIQSKSIHEHHLASLSSLKSASGGHNDLGGSSGTGVGGAGALSSLSAGLGGLGGSGSSGISRLGVNLDAKGASKEMSPESVADLVDLEQELSSIQRGITQMERITPNDPSHPSVSGSKDEDPFGDSFTHFPKTYNLLPPPESGRSRSKPGSKPTDSATSGTGGSVSGSQSIGLPPLLTSALVAGSASPSALQQEEEDSWLNELDPQNDVFDTSKMASGGTLGLSTNLPLAPLAASESTSTPTQQLSENSALEDVCASGSATAASLPFDAEQSPASVRAVKSDAFTDLDPLGTGRTRPYVDKKYFFQELKNPPKKVLKDLSAGHGVSSAAAAATATTAAIPSQLSASAGIDGTGAQYKTAAAAVVDEFLTGDGLFDEAATLAADDSESQRQQQHQPPYLQPQKSHPTLSTNLTTNTNNSNNSNKSADSTTATVIASEAVMLPRDTDPFSPTRKKSDPFQDGDIFSKLDPFEFEFSAASKPGETTAQRASPTTAATESRRVTTEVFNGPLQVNLPPERGISPPSSAGVHWKSDISRLERQSSVSPTITGGSSVRSRPTPSAATTLSASAMTSHGHAPSSSVFKQQTVDVISSISNKKMPHLFGQARFSKRGDSNTINMRRLQESDSLSETETAPEPPPRPDSALHVEPPPLPPKKQFNDFVIRPRVTSGNAVPPPVANSLSTMSATTSSANRYEFLNSVPSSKLSAADVPPIPLPSRRVGRSDGAYPGPGRPRKPGHTDDDYLAPLGANAGTASSSVAAATGADVPPLLPPPTQVSTRARAQRQQSLPYKAQELYENKSEILQQQQQQEASEESAAIIPDITLSQLLTLGVDELATKLNVPTSKLNTMTLVELTSYLSEFIEKSKPTSQKTPAAEPASPLPSAANKTSEQASIFKVNFDPQATFVAKFDDTFGEDVPGRQQRDGLEESFVANFEQFNEPPVAPPILTKAGGAPAVPSADRYAVFREIIDQELQTQLESVDLMGMSDVPTPAAQSSAGDADGIAVNDAETNGIVGDLHFKDAEDDFLTPKSPATIQPPALKIDTKITEVVAQAKDRYAALRDIILVENLFEKKTQAQSEADFMQEYPEFSDEFAEDQDVKQIMRNRVTPGADRLLDSRGLPAEPSSSAVTVEDDDDEEDDDGAGESSLDSNDKESATPHDPQDQYEKLSTSTQQLDVDQACIEKSRNGDGTNTISNLPTIKQDSKFLTVAGSSGLSSSKDDLEIDELMQRAISNLSLDSREHISPAAASVSSAPGPRSTSATLGSTQSPIPGTALQHRSPVSLGASNAQKSPQISPITAQLTAVSKLIDTATKQMSGVLGSETEVPHKSMRKEAWATFDSPKAAFPDIGAPEKRSTRGVKTGKSTSLHLPPAPPSNTSQNDTAESPCSSDPRDDGWGKSRRCWPKAKDRQQTSSSSRDLSPWDDEAPDYQKQQQKQRMLAAAAHGQLPAQAHLPHADRHGYYMRHARRMNSCDEDYDYEEEFTNRRDHRKFKQGLSRSRDNFDLESPSWYHHPAHHTWSPQDVEQAAAVSRARSFERSAYERTTYGPPIYDKRTGGVTSSSYERRGGYDKRKYYRDYVARPNYEFDEYGESPSIQDRYREPGSFDKVKLGRRSDYENVYDDGRTPLPMMYGGGGSRSRAEYSMYERERKSFDRDSVESFESASRRRRSFGSGDVYGSLESREEFRERYMMGGGGEKTRSLRKGMKLRTAGDIDYEQDSENDFHQRSRVGVAGSSGGVGDARSLQRPSQLVPGSGSSMTRMRKSSGSSPWDGDEPPLPGQKSTWKRPASAADSERRLAESRRAAAIGQTPSGSDGEKDRRFRKKTRARGKDFPQNSGIMSSVPSSSGPNTGGRYGGNYDSVGANSVTVYPPAGEDIDNDEEDDDEDYVDEEYDEPPTDEDKFERLNRRRHEMHQRMLESERRQHMGAKSSKGTMLPPTATKRYHHHGSIRSMGTAGGNNYEFDDYDDQTPTPRSNASSTHPASTSGGCGSGAGTKFSFDGGGFESDFNQSSPPPAPAGTASSCNSTPAASGSASVTKSSFRFSNDFSDREKLQHFAQNSTSISSLQQFDLDAATSPASHATPSITQKLRFDDNVKVSQFDDAAFEDDFSKAQFDFARADEQWNQAEPTQSGPTTVGVSSNSAASTAAAPPKKQNLRNSKLQQRQELIKKSESINIFAKKAEDPFEDDEFFQAPNNDAKPTTTPTSSAAHSDRSNDYEKRIGGNGFQWENDSNFAKFDENM